MITGPIPRLPGRGRAAAAQVPCPHCGYAYSRQVATGATPDGYRRKRVCLREERTEGREKCGRQFTTYEVGTSELKLLRKIRDLVRLEK